MGGDWTRNTPREEYPALKSIYELYDKAPLLEMVQIDAPHNYNRQSREAMYRFFGKVEHYRGRGRKRERATQGHYEANYEPQVLRRKYPGYDWARPPKEFTNLSGAQFQDTLF